LELLFAVSNAFFVPIVEKTVRGCKSAFTEKFAGSTRTKVLVFLDEIQIFVRLPELVPVTMRKKRPSEISEGHREICAISGKKFVTNRNEAQIGSHGESWKMS